MEDSLDKVAVVKTEPSIESLPSASLSPSILMAKYESLIREEISPSGCEPFPLENFVECSDLSLPDDTSQILPEDCDCDIVNLDLRTSEACIIGMLEMHSPDSCNSSHHSVFEGFSSGSRPSTTYTLSTNPSINELCNICNDLATGKHYGVSACEGCKGFFKRTIRKQITFTCREFNNCPVTEKLRNRCQACRFKKCLEKGMKIEAVQKERPLKRKLSVSDSSVSSPESVITAESIYKNEVSSSNIIVDSDGNETVEVEEMQLLCSIINKQLFNLVIWAKDVPGFSQLDRSDQMILLNKSWVEIFLASVAFRSTLDNDSCSIKMDETYRLTVSVATNFGLQHLIIRIIRELVNTFKSLSIDQMEMACLKIIILFDSNFGNLKDSETINNFRLCIFGILKKYVTEKYPREPFRTCKLLLKLSSIRGLTSCFVQKMRVILHECLLNDEASTSSISEKSNSESLFPLFNEMMNQQEFPFS